MATGVGSAFSYYNPEAYTLGLIEGYGQQLALFNAATRGAIVLKSRLIPGDYENVTEFTRVADLVTRRDITSTADVTDLSMATTLTANVKLNRKIGPVGMTVDAWKKLGSTSEKMSYLLGFQAAQDKLAEMLNTSLSALEAAIQNVAALNYDGSSDTTPTLTHDKLVKGVNKFGDAADAIVCFVGHSGALSDLLVNSLNSTNMIANVGGVVVNEGHVGTLNKPFVTTDSTALYEGTSGSADMRYIVLGLTPGAIVIEESEPGTVLFDLVSGQENIIARYQAEYVYNLGLKGYGWNRSNGGVNPTAANVATGSNWDQKTTSVKYTAGVRIKADSSIA